MSDTIGVEIHQFLNCLWYGVVLFGVYDALRIWRAFLHHASWAIEVEDLLFWIWAGFYLFAHFFVDTYGAVRVYQLLAVVLGGSIWEYGCGRFLTRKVIFCIRWLKFRVRRCKLSIGMRSLRSQKKKEKAIQKEAVRQKKNESESVTGSEIAGEKDVRKKSKKKSKRKSKQNAFG